MTDPIAPSAPDFPQGWPRLGLGCAPLGDLFQHIPEEQAAGTLKAAWEAGIRYFDTAPWYGHGLSEHRLGACLRQHDRADYVVSTKVGRVYEPAPRGHDMRIKWQGGSNFGLRFDYTAEGFAQSLAQSQLRLGQPVIDALVIHDLDRGYHGDAFDGHLTSLTDSGLPWLLEQKRAGAISAIGMGINALEDFADLASWIEVDFFLVAMPYTLLDQASLAGPMAECARRGIRVVIGAPLASGLLTDPTRPGLRYAYEPASDAIRGKAQRIQRVCGDHGVSLIAAALQFPLLHPAVVSVIPGADMPDQVRQNASEAAVPIPPALWSDLKSAGLIDSESPTG